MPIRLRLALWCGTILAVGLLGFSTLIYLLAGHNLRTAADQVIAGRAQRLDTMLSTAGQGGAVAERGAALQPIGRNATTVAPALKAYGMKKFIWSRLP